MLSFHLTNSADVPNLHFTTPYPRYTEVKQRSNLQDSAEDPQGMFFHLFAFIFSWNHSPTTCKSHLLFSTLKIPRS